MLPRLQVEQVRLAVHRLGVFKQQEFPYRHFFLRWTDIVALVITLRDVSVAPVAVKHHPARFDERILAIDHHRTLDGCALARQRMIVDAQVIEARGWHVKGPLDPPRTIAFLPFQHRFRAPAQPGDRINQRRIRLGGIVDTGQFDMRSNRGSGLCLEFNQLLRVVWLGCLVAPLRRVFAGNSQRGRGGTAGQDRRQ